MAKKTNKTSHVLNLITGGNGDTEPDARQVEEPLQTEQNVVVVASEEEERIAEDIRKQLLKEMGEEKGDLAEPEKSDAAAEEAVTPLETVSEAAAAPETEEDAEEATEEATEGNDEPPYRMVNVMEAILSPEVIKKEMEKYGVCLCSRCQADVLALLLTRLPAKYIVTNIPAIPPLISYYRNKYRVNLMTQTIKACLDVREHPRHDRKEPYSSEEFADN